MSDAVLEQIREIIQRDVNGRGLASDPCENLITACSSDFAAACHSLAAARSIGPASQPVVGFVTGFHIPSANASETDGPLGSIFLCRALDALGFHVWIYSEESSYLAIKSALESLPIHAKHMAFDFGVVGSDPGPCGPWRLMTHLLAIERPGPSHTLESLWKQARPGLVPEEAFRNMMPGEHSNQYHTMSGQVITGRMYPAHYLFETRLPFITIGIGDGGNEIGMGKIPWEVIARNIPNGGLIACRVPTDYNIVCGVSNWGAYGLAAGVWYLRGMKFDEELFSADRERELWEKVLQEAVLVDGVTGQRTLTVDGLSWEDYIQPLREIGDVLRASSPR